jgi:hypothetical protein
MNYSEPVIISIPLPFQGGRSDLKADNTIRLLGAQRIRTKKPNAYVAGTNGKGEV